MSEHRQPNTKTDKAALLAAVVANPSRGFKSLGDEFGGITRERVRQIVKKAGLVRPRIGSKTAAEKAARAGRVAAAKAYFDDLCTTAASMRSAGLTYLQIADAMCITNRASDQARREKARRLAMKGGSPRIGKGKRPKPQT